MDQKPVADEIRAFHESATAHCVRVAGEISQRDDRIAELESRIEQLTEASADLFSLVDKLSAAELEIDRLRKDNAEMSSAAVCTVSDAEAEDSFDRAICAVAAETQRMSSITAVYLSVETRDKLTKVVDAMARELYLGRSAR